jgi:hypothetical protein
MAARLGITLDAFPQKKGAKSLVPGPLGRAIIGTMRPSGSYIATVALLLGLVRAASQQTIYFEAEKAQFPGDWNLESRTESYAGTDLLSNMSGAGNDAMAIFTVSNAGTFNVWVRSRDFDTYTGQRRYQVGLDGMLFPFILGAHGTNGWLWERVGSRALTAQQHVFSLKDTSQFYPRCDAVFLTTNATDPNQLSYSQLSAYTVTLPKVPFRNLDSPDGVALRFNSAAEATNNIRALLNGALLAYSTNDAGILRFTAPSNGVLATAVFDASPRDGATNINRYGNVTVDVDLRFGAAQESFGIFTRIPGTEDNSHLVLVNCEQGGAGTAETFRIFAPGSDPRANIVSSTVLLQDTTNVLTTNVWYSFTLTVKNNGSGGAVFNLNIADRSTGTNILSKAVTNSSGALTSPGEVGLRFYSTNGGNGETLDVDNLSITEKAPDVLTNATRTLLATLQGSGLRASFYAQPDIDGATQITRDTAILVSNVWVTVPFAQGSERLFLLFRDSVNPSTSAQYITAWSQHIDFELNGVIYATTGSTEDPLLAARMEVLIPRSCVQIDSQTVQVTCLSLDGRTVVVTWQLGPGGSDLSITANCMADRTGNYSLGFLSFGPSTRTQASFDLLPPLVQFQRLPAAPKLFTSSVTPQPLALVQRTFSGLTQPVTFGVVAEPTKFAFEWPAQRNAEYGFSILNTDGTVQPAIFSPILGLKNSLVSTGAMLSASWRIVAKLGDWKAGLEYASGEVLGVTDYRQPYRSSLTHSLLNMFDLMEDDDHDGWNNFLKGHIQIESESTVTHPSPLTYLSASVLTHNESLYQARSLQTLEYSLSRPRQHFAITVTTNMPSGYITTNSTVITVPSTFDGTAYWQGAYHLLGRLDPWIATLAVTNGGVRYDVGSSAIPRWLEKMGQYRLNPSEALLQQIQTDCNAWLNSEFVTAKTNPVNISSFYHFGFYPFWWGLLDLYELTTNATYLSYAEEGAFHTMAGIFSHPLGPPGNVTANPGGSWQTNWTIWWKDDTRSRLGWPRSAGDTPERQVPGWLVSPVGYTLEQPTTYYQTGPADQPFNLIMMASWAPHLLRLYRYTGRDIYQTYARNAMIGRFSNEPGYYLRGFTDMFHDPQYPWVGPDVTSFYYHHFQARMGFVIDYLMAQAELMSQGQIAFPWAKQFGYVWFTSRAFGTPGTMYGETGLRPWFDRAAAQVDTEQVDYLLARGTDSFWVVLMNQSNAPTVVNVTNAASALGIVTSQPVKVWQAAQAQPDLSYNSPMTVTIPARTLVALRFTTQARDFFPRTLPLTASPTNQALPGQWGTMNAFRTRSPFGSDSLYVILTGRPAGNASVTLHLDGTAPVTKAEYPYEFSVYPWPMNQDMRFTLELVNCTTNYSTAVTLAGTTATAPTAYQDWKTSHGLFANASDSEDLDGDGWCNLLEYALNLDPQVKDAPPSAACAIASGTLTLSYIKWRSDVTYFVETSPDLQTWTRQGVTEAANGANVTASLPIASVQSCFLRLRVAYP